MSIILYNPIYIKLINRDIKFKKYHQQVKKETGPGNSYIPGPENHEIKTAFQLL